MAFSPLAEIMGAYVADPVAGTRRFFASVGVILDSLPYGSSPREVLRVLPQEYWTVRDYTTHDVPRVDVCIHDARRLLGPDVFGGERTSLLMTVSRGCPSLLERIVLGVGEEVLDVEFRDERLSQVTLRSPRGSYTYAVPDGSGCRSSPHRRQGGLGTVGFCG